MPGYVTKTPIGIAAEENTRQGYLICVDDILVAVVSKVDSADPAFTAGGWLLEAGFGSGRHRDPLFKTLDDVEAWALSLPRKRSQSDGPDAVKRRAISS